MQPVRSLQTRLCRKCLGGRRWGELTTIRLDLLDDDYTPMTVFERGLRKGHYDSAMQHDSSNDGDEGEGAAHSGTGASRGTSTRRNSSASNGNAARRRNSTTSATNSGGGGSAAGGTPGRVKRQLSVGTDRRRSLSVMDFSTGMSRPICTVCNAYVSTHEPLHTHSPRCP